MRRAERNCCFWAACFLVSWVIGCGGGSREPVGQVTGKVTFGGSPVTEGTISFMSKTGRSGAGKLNSDGSFTIASENQGLPPGTYKVVVVPPEVEVPGDGTSLPAMIHKEMPNIPEKYRSEETTDLQVTIKEGANEIPVTLK